MTLQFFILFAAKFVVLRQLLQFLFFCSSRCSALSCRQPQKNEATFTLYSLVYIEFVSFFMYEQNPHSGLHTTLEELVEFGDQRDTLLPRRVQAIELILDLQDSPSSFVNRRTYLGHPGLAVVFRRTPRFLSQTQTLLFQHSARYQCARRFKNHLT